MVATPQYCGFNFVGLQTGKTYSIDGYISDVNGASINLDSGGGASSTSSNYWVCPEDVALVDYSMITGTADTEKIRLTANGKPTFSILRYTNHLTTLNNRPALNVRFKAGTQISAIQISD